MNYNYILATNNFMYVVKSDCLRLKELDLLKSKHQTQTATIRQLQRQFRFCLTLFKINLLVCRNFDISSVLFLNRTFGSGRAIIIFPVRHKLQLLVPHLTILILIFGN